MSFRISGINEIFRFLDIYNTLITRNIFTASIPRTFFNFQITRQSPQRIRIPGK